MKADEQERLEAYTGGEAWKRLSRTAYQVIPKRALCSMPKEWQEKYFELFDEMVESLELPESDVSGYRIEAYSDVNYNDEAGEDEYDFCDDPLSEYRHTGPLPLKGEDQ